MKTSCAVLGAVLAAWSAAAGADGKTVLLTDFTGDGEWTVSQWSKAKGRLAVRAELPARLEGVKEKKSLGVKIPFPGGEGFRFMNLLPARKCEPIAGKVLSVSLWIKGTDTGHFIQLNLADAKGGERKLGLGTLKFAGWKQVAAKVPADWPQPLTVQSLTFHDWAIRTPADLTTYVTRLEAVVEGKGDAPAAKPRRPSRPAENVPGEGRLYSDLNIPGEWQPEQWNKTPGRLATVEEFPQAVATEPGEMRRSLRLEMDLAARRYQAFTIVPAEAGKVPYRLLEVRLWAKGAAAPLGLVLHFADAGGDDVSVGTEPAEIALDGWKQLVARVPADREQPLTIKSIVVQGMGPKEAATVQVHLTRMETVIDAREKVRDRYEEANRTDDNW